MGCEMKKVVSGGPVRAAAFPQADAGLPDTTFFICEPMPDCNASCLDRAGETLRRFSSMA
jgi:hypothetical protein